MLGKREKNLPCAAGPGSPTRVSRGGVETRRAAKRSALKFDGLLLLCYPWRRPSPMPYFHAVDYIPWIGSTIAECLVVGIMLRRNLVREFPVFFSSIVFDLYTRRG